MVFKKKYLKVIREISLLFKKLPFGNPMIQCSTHIVCAIGACAPGRCITANIHYPLLLLCTRGPNNNEKSFLRTQVKFPHGLIQTAVLKLSV